MEYSFDTSCFIVPYRNAMPIDLFPSLWVKLGELIDTGAIVASKEVYEEISRKDDDLLVWIKDRKKMFIEVDSEQGEYVSEIVNRYPRWIDINSQKNNADPYVIALAKSYDLTVVSFERGGNEEKPTIPYVCQVLNVPHLFFHDFLRAIGWQAL